MPHAAAPRLLAIDTATEVLALAVSTAEGRWTRELPGGAAASATLLPAVQALLAEAGLRPTQLSAVAFGCGPGAFTGLRTACAAAQGLALGAGCPVLPLDNLLLLADDALAQCAQGVAGVGASAAMALPAVGDEWWVAIDARMDEVYAGRWRCTALAAPDAGRPPAPAAGGLAALGLQWQPQDPPALFTLPALAQRWLAQPPQRLAGNAAQVFADRLPLPGVVAWPRCADRAAALLRLAEAAWARGEAVAPDQALPVYVRDKVALTTAERVAERAATAPSGHG